jgi:hypothetical protein
LQERARDHEEQHAPDPSGRNPARGLPCADRHEREPVNAQLVIRASDVWRNGVAGASDVSEEQMKRVVTALSGNLT